MNKLELIARIAGREMIPKVRAGRIVDDVLDLIAQEMRKSGSVKIKGFGSFVLKTRPARNGRNPQTGEIIVVRSCNYVKFVPSSSLKEYVNK